MSPYSVYVTPQALAELRALPGHVRQRVRRAIDAMVENARPSRSRRLAYPDASVDLRRLRLDHWRIVYLANDDDLTIDVLAVRRRPPYDYGDLAVMLADLD